MFRWLFGGGKREQEPPKVSEAEQAELEAEYQAWDEKKSAFFERVLGTEHDMVMHAIIPFAIGGGLDLYYYPNLPDALGGQGTAIATKELVETPGDGPSNRVYEAYELVMVTRHPLNLDEAKQPETDFGQAHKTINSVLNAVARYAPEATLNPHETLSFPDDFGDLSHRNFIFDAVSAPEASKAEGVGLMLIMEIFESEKDYAHGQQAGAELLEMLKAAGHYPYSDMDREAVA